jgi:hypothetical protein
MWEYIDCTLALPCFGWVVMLPANTAVAPQSGTKDQFYCTVYYITFNSNCEAQGVSRNLKKNVQDRVRSQN